jgi:hypothetical protein
MWASSHVSCVSPLIPITHHCSLVCLSHFVSALFIIPVYKPLYAHYMPVSNTKLFLTTQELTAPGAPGCLLCGLCVEPSTLRYTVGGPVSASINVYV